MPAPASTATAPARVIPTCGQLFMGFFWLGVTAFGGALPLARRMLVEHRRWLADDEFVDLLGLCQFLPGGNIINLSVAVGMKFRGPRGAYSALLGLILAPTLIVISLGSVYQTYQGDPRVQHLFAGLAAAAAGLLVSMAIRIARPLRGNPWGMAVAAACFAAIALLRLPLLPTMAVLTPLSIFITWRLRR